MQSGKDKIIRTATVPLSLDLFCRGLFQTLADEYDVVALSSPGKELGEIRKREGIRTIAVPMRRKVAPLSDLKSLLHLIRVFRKENPRMVHSITPKAGLLSMMAARIAGVPVRIHSFTGLVFPYRKGLMHFILRITDSITAACATYVLPEGEGVMDDLQRYHITKTPMRVLGNGNVRGIDLDYYDHTADIDRLGEDLRRHFGIGEGEFAFLYVGRFDQDKGFKELTEAFERLAAKYPGVHLLLAGAQESEGDKLDENIASLISSHPAIHISQGWLDDVRPWYAAADAFVHSSYREGFPNVVIEAGAMGLASIVTNINGSREIILDGENGVIIPPHDAEALYLAMRSFIKDRDYVKSLASHARSLVSIRYEMQYVRNCLIDFYREVLQ